MRLSQPAAAGCASISTWVYRSLMSSPACPTSRLRATRHPQVRPPLPAAVPGCAAALTGEVYVRPDARTGPRHHQHRSVTVPGTAP